MRSSKLVLTCLAGALALPGTAWSAEETKAAKVEKADKVAKRGGRMGGRWMLGMQAYTFHQDTLFEAIDNTKELGLRYMEIFPGQALSPEKKDVKINENASDELIKEVQEKLKSAGVRAVSFGVVGLGDEAASRKVFEFAKKMGMQVIASEPDPAPEHMKMLDKLANEFEISIAIHNHPKPSKYWNPDTVLKAVEGCSKRIGACADTGHWTRSGLVPLECLKKLEGRIISSHFKDLNEKGPKAHDVVWGTGVNQAGDLLKELQRQGFHGPIMIEYEYNWGKAMPEIKQCVEYFRKTVQEMRGPARQKGGEKSKTE